MIKTILIDDDINLRMGMKSLLKRHVPEIEVVAEADSVQSGIQTIESTPADVLFLDIQLGDGTGFDILEQLTVRLGKIHHHVVFITAFEQYAIRAFRFSALDYLLKPVDPEDLKKVTDKIILAMARNPESEKVELLLENIRKKNENFNRIVLSNSDGMQVVDIKEIIRCESEDNYTRFFVKGQKAILISKTLKEYEELLSPHNFERIHQSHLVNMSFVKSFIKKDGFFAVLTDDTQLPVSQRKKERFLNVLKNIGQ